MGMLKGKVRSEKRGFGGPAMLPLRGGRTQGLFKRSNRRGERSSGWLRRRRDSLPKVN